MQRQVIGCPTIVIVCETNEANLETTAIKKKEITS